MTFVTIAAASLSAQRPLSVVVVRFLRALRTTCSCCPRVTRVLPATRILRHAHAPYQLRPTVIVALPGRRRSVAVEGAP